MRLSIRCPGAVFIQLPGTTSHLLLSVLLGVPVALSENATNYIFVGLLYPVGMFAFMRVAFPDRREILLWGAACVLAIAAFPW